MSRLACAKKSSIMGQVEPDGKNLQDASNRCVIAGARIKSGVPKESVIEPLIFLLFVSDLPSVINVNTLLFADDA